MTPQWNFPKPFQAGEAVRSSGLRAGIMVKEGGVFTKTIGGVLSQTIVQLAETDCCALKVPLNGCKASFH